MSTRTELPSGWTMPLPARRRRRFAGLAGALTADPRRARRTIAVLIGLGVAGGVFAGTGYDYDAAPRSHGSAEFADLVPRPEQEEAIRKLRRQLAGMQVGKNYIVVDQANNRLYLRRGEELLHEAICSSGSGYILKEGDESGNGGRTWVFDSPRGEFKVRTKIDKPVWKKPDWAFVEAGEPIPKDPSERFEYGVLGEHALYFGNGFMIHGTLYERLLGRSVTHGCIRLGRDDLRTVYQASPIGTRIFIY